MVDVVEEEVPEGCEGFRSLSLREERVESHERLDGEVDRVDELGEGEDGPMKTKREGGR